MKIILSLPIFLLFGSTWGASIKNKSITLQQLMQSAGNDTTRIKSCYLYAGSCNIDSIPQWEQLSAKMHACNMIAYEIKTLKKIGRLWNRRGNRKKARVTYEKAIWLAEHNGMTEEVLKLMIVLYDNYFASLDRKKTLDCIMKGIKIAEKAGNKEGMANFYSFLALYYMTSGDYERALAMQFKALQKCREIHYDRGIASSLVDIGTTYVKMGQQNKSIPYYLESKKYLKVLEGTDCVVEIYCATSEAYRCQKKYDSAQVNVQKAYRAAQEINQPISIAGALVTMGWLADDMGHYDKAEKYAQQARSIADRINYQAQLPSIYLLLKNVYTHRGNYRKALEVYELFVNQKDSLSNEKIRKGAAEKEYAYNLEKKENENKLLKQQKEIQALELRQDRYIYVGIGATVFVLLVVAYLFMRHRKYKTDHQHLQLEQKLLRAQMNPHFVFNSLNSIQQFIMEERNKKAETYLFKFSTLIRNLLESNIKDSLSIEEEITMLQAYLEMEALRFGSRFSYSVQIDKRLNVNQVNIPHLMLQPFVENAIWHGLLPKKGNRTLQVRVEYDTACTIRCTVDDNGIGREASKGKANTFGKKSLALEFVNQRISLIKKTYGIQGSVNIVDKKDEHGKGNGTTVVLILPIIKNQ